jgi:nucleolar protein 15
MCCKFVGEEVPKERLHPNTFKGCNRKFKKPKASLLARDRHNQPRTVAQQRATVKRLVSRKKKSLKKLADVGIDYELPKLRSKSEQS